MPIYKHVAEITTDCSDTKPVMFFAQDNILYFYATDFHPESGFLLSGVLCMVLFPVTGMFPSQWLTATYNVKYLSSLWHLQANYFLSHSEL
jgi:hypothetical protein